MASGTHGATPLRGGDPHGWNSVENFRHIHETRLAEHPFVDHNKPHTLILEEYEVDENVYLSLCGEVYCYHNVIVEVAKYYDTMNFGGRLNLRGFSYRYNAHVKNGHNVLRYDNGHKEAPEEFHRHEYDPENGVPRETKLLTRYELPDMYDIITEIQAIAEKWIAEREPTGGSST